MGEYLLSDFLQLRKIHVHKICLKMDNFAVPEITN